MSSDPLFEAEFLTILNDEGGDKVTRDPDDPGGTTKYGISQRFLDTVAPGRKAEDLTQEEAKALYYEHFWLEYKFPDISFVPEIARKVFNFMVTAGPDPAFRCLQRALRACGCNVKEDGVMGPMTRAALKAFTTNMNPQTSLAGSSDNCLLLMQAFGVRCALRSEIAGYYRDLDKPKFEAGWVARAYR